jgi:hypothetical protein
MTTAINFGRKKAQEAQQSEGLDGVLEDGLADFVLATAEVDEQAMLDSIGAEVAENLRDVFVVEGFHCFDFDEQCFVDKQVGPEIAKNGSVLVLDGERKLGLHDDLLFAQPVQQRVLVNFLDMPVPVMAMNGKPRFTHHLAQLEDFLCVHSSGVVEPFAPFCG